MCTLPFNYIEVYKDGAATCCPAWNKVGIVKRPLTEIWNSPEFNQAREALKTGNVDVYCRTWCPRYRQEQQPGSYLKVPKHLRVAFDETCNLRCQTCRSDFIRTDESFLKQRLQEIEELFGQNLESIELSGAGEVTASPVLREWLFNLTEDRFPKLRRVHFHTNGLLFNEHFWNQLPKFVQDCVDGIDVSIDAATKETYEKIRVGGKWETLLSSLEFIKSLNKSYIFCFVVQRDNYKEISQFYDFIHSVFPRCRILYQTVDDWGRNSEDYVRQNIFADLEAREELRKQLKSVIYKQGVSFYGELPEFLGKKTLI